MFKVILYYKYVHLPDPEAAAAEQRKLCELLNLKGRILLAVEGINGTLEGSTESINAYCQALDESLFFSGIRFKFSEGSGKSFPKLSVKVRNEIVASYLDRKIDPSKQTGKYLSSEALNNWFESKKEFFIVDMRNSYETSVGFFENSIFSNLANFRFLPEVLENLKQFKNKTIVTVCTGGVRCEKASAFLIENNFSDVYQLKDGIFDYLEKYPDRHFKGKLYVFDQRVLIGFNSNQGKDTIVGKCLKCRKYSEEFVNCAFDECHLHFICCSQCLVNRRAFCSEKCLQAGTVRIIENT